MELSANFAHKKLTPSDQRCFNCGSLKHKVDSCDRPKKDLGSNRTPEKENPDEDNKCKMLKLDDFFGRQRL